MKSTIADFQQVRGKRDTLQRFAVIETVVRNTGRCLRNRDPLQRVAFTEKAGTQFRKGFRQLCFPYGTAAVKSARANIPHACRYHNLQQRAAFRKRVISNAFQTVREPNMPHILHFGERTVPYFTYSLRHDDLMTGIFTGIAKQNAVFDQKIHCCLPPLLLLRFRFTASYE